MHEAGIEIVLVTTIVNNVNNDQVGPIVKFAMENPKKIAFVSFQPVSSSPDATRTSPRSGVSASAIRCPIWRRTSASRWARSNQRAIGSPFRSSHRLRASRTWFTARMLNGERSPAVATPELRRGCTAMMMIHKETKEWAPISRFLNAPQLVKDVSSITDAARGKKFSSYMMAMALLKNYKPFQAPPSLRLKDLWLKFDKTWAVSKDADKKYGRTNPNRTYEDAMKRRQNDPWNMLFIAGMWFQDLFNYDFRRTEMCIILHATQQRAKFLSAHTFRGVGWRKIIENMHKNATVAQWYKEHGKHDIYAKGKKVDLQSYEHSLRIDEDDASRVRHLEHDIPVTAAEEDRIRRKKAFEEAAKVRKIYEELVLKKPQEKVVQIGTIQQLQMAVPGATVKPVQIAPANGNGNGTAKVEQTGGGACRRRLELAVTAGFASFPAAPVPAGADCFFRGSLERSLLWDSRGTCNPSAVLPLAPR